MAASLVAMLGLRAAARSEDPPPPATVDLQILGTNDLHGYLEPRGDEGGAAWLAAYLNKAEGDVAAGHTIRVHAGDMIGASPLISTHFRHRSTIEAINAMRFDVGTVGNHEFDEGTERLRETLGGAAFPYVSANVVDLDHRLRLPPYAIVERAGVKVGFIGVTTPSASRYLLPRLARHLRFLDMSESVNRSVAELRRRGVKAIVVLAHSGAFQDGGPGARAAGEVVDETREMDDAVDVVIAGHTHSYLNTRVDGKLIVESYAFGSAVDRVQLRAEPRTGDVVSSSADIVRTSHSTVAPDRRVARLVARYAHRARPVAARVVANARRGFTKERGDLGRLVADAQRELARADMAVVNPGNMRASLSAGPVTYGALCAIEAYGHPVMTMRIAGSALPALLEQQWNAGRTTALFTSGLRYRREGSKAIDLTDDRGRPISPDRTYSIAANELIATGGRFSVLRDRGRAKRAVGSDLRALVAYLQRHPEAVH